MSAIRVVYLGRLAEMAGRVESEFASSSGDLDWPDLVEVLRNHVNAEISDAARDQRTKIALNGAIVGDREGMIVRNGDEVALLPPVSGG